VRVFTGADGQNAPGDVVTNSSTGGQTFAPQGSEAVESCKADSLAGRIGCVFVDIIIAFIAAFVGVFTTLLQWSVAAFNFSIHASVIEYGQWYAKIQDPITRGWTLFRDLANIGIIGIFVFIAISIILGLHEYGQKKLIARVIIVATLINFSFLFTTIVINASNAVATVVYQTTLTKDDPAGLGPTKGLGDQFLKYLGASSFRNTVNTLTHQYNNKESSFLAVLLYAFFIMLFSLAATFVFLYGAFLLFARFVILLLLLTMSAAAFATYLWPSLAESGWGTWRTQLLRNSILAPVLMLFLLIALDAAQAFAVNKVIGAGATPSFTDMINSPADSTLWAMTFAFLVILGFLFGGMYIASRLASGMAGRFASSMSGSFAGAGAGVTAWAGRNSFGRLSAINSKAYGATANRLTKDIEAERAKGSAADPRKIAKWEKEYDRMRRKEFNSGERAKRTYDPRGVSGVNSLLKAAGTPAALSDATKKNFAQIAKDTADHAAKDAAKATIKRSDAENIARKQLGSTEEDKARADQEARDAQKAIKEARQEGLQRIAEHQQAERDAEELKHQLEEQHRTAASDEERTQLQSQIETVNERISAARRSATSARTRMEDTVSRERPKSLNYTERVTAKTKEILDANQQRVGDIAAHHTLSRPKQLVYDAFGVHPDGHVAKLAREKATGIAKNKEDWDKKKEEREYTQPATAAPAPHSDAAQAH
jgi:hypothetical protein